MLLIFVNLQGPKEINRRDAQSLRQFEQRDNCRVSQTTFEATQILLAESRLGLQLFLSETLFSPQTAEICTDQFPHIHR